MTDPYAFVPSYNQLPTPPQPPQNQEQPTSQLAYQPRITQAEYPDSSLSQNQTQTQVQGDSYTQQNGPESSKSEELQPQSPLLEHKEEPPASNSQIPSKKYVKQFGDIPSKKKKIPPLAVAVAVIVFLLIGVLAFFLYEQNALKRSYSINAEDISGSNEFEADLNDTKPVEELDNNPKKNIEAEGPVITSPTATPSALLDTTIEPEPDSLPVYEMGEQFEDEEFGYSVSYGEEWIFRKTYGADVVTVVETNVLSGFDLHLYDEADEEQKIILGNVGVNLLSAEEEREVDDWIQEHELNEPRAEKRKIQFNQVSANYYTYPDEPNKQTRALFFIKGDYMYKIWWWGANDEALDQAMAIVETFAAAE